MDFKRTQGLKKDSDFRKVYKHGKSFANRNLVMYILDNKSDSTRVGISVSKKVGNAINRNKVRRRIKEKPQEQSFKSPFRTNTYAMKTKTTWLENYMQKRF